MLNDELKELIKYENIPQMKKVELILSNNNIAYWNRSFEDTAYNGIYTIHYGLGKIFVFKKDYEKAKKLLKDEGII